MLAAAPFDRHMPINRGMTYEQMLDAVETQPVHVIEATLDDDTSGLYCEAVQTINHRRAYDRRAETMLSHP